MTFVEFEDPNNGKMTQSQLNEIKLRFLEKDAEKLSTLNSTISLKESEPEAETEAEANQAMQQLTFFHQGKKYSYDFLNKTCLNKVLVTLNSFHHIDDAHSRSLMYTCNGKDSFTPLGGLTPSLRLDQLFTALKDSENLIFTWTQYETNLYSLAQQAKDSPFSKEIPVPFTNNFHLNHQLS